MALIANGIPYNNVITNTKTNQMEKKSTDGKEIMGIYWDTEDFPFTDRFICFWQVQVNVYFFSYY